MIPRIQHAMRALQMLMRAQEVTANNLANMNTPGFKADRIYFKSIMDDLNGNQVSAPQPFQTLSMAQGAFEATGNSFDFAISGEGFFEMDLEGEKFLTRNGRFSLDSDGYLKDDNGAYVQGTSGNVQIPELSKSSSSGAEAKLEVAKDGTIRVNGEVFDRINIVTVEKIEDLERRTNAYFALADGQETEAVDDDVEVVQGYYESGNVSPITELVDMTRNMQLFESQQKVMQTTDEILSRVTTNLGRF